MNNLKNNWVLYSTLSLVIVCLLGLGMSVSASQTFKQMLAEQVAKIIAPQIVTDINSEVATDDTLGAVSGPDYTWDYQNFNGLTTYVKTGGFTDGTTTLGCIKNPFGVTSTIDLAEVLVTGPSTTTFTMVVGTSTVATGLTTSTLPNGILSATISANTTGLATNNMNLAYSGFYAGGTVAKLAVAPTEYVCIVAGEGGGSTTGVTQATNSFAGSYKLRFYR